MKCIVRTCNSSIVEDKAFCALHELLYLADHEGTSSPSREEAGMKVFNAFKLVVWADSINNPGRVRNANDIYDENYTIRDAARRYYATQKYLTAHAKEKIKT